MALKNFVIGINSGTSFDGIDIALVQFQNNNLKPKFIDGIVYEYPRIIKDKIRALIEAKHSVPVREISQLNFLLGNIFADAALKIIRKNRLQSKDILLIASHGQTIFHHPNKEKIHNYKISSTFQIGESSVISGKTGIRTISNFREADITAGGQGAPLMPFLDWVMFNNSSNIKAVLNIGGISNVTVVGKNISPIAFDIGPGNALIDLVSKIYFKKDYDKDGKLALKGKINFASVETALKDKYFKLRPPKSTGKEYFNLRFIQKYFSRIKKKEDKLATVTFFSSKAIEKGFRDFVLPKYTVGEIIVSGGGIKNKTLIKHLQQLPLEASGRKPLMVQSDKYGLPYKYKEAILFALLGYTCHKRIKNNLPSCTGAKKKAILGRIINV